MKRLLLPSSSFSRTLSRLVKSDPQISGKLLKAMNQLAVDAFHPSLKTHKLSGKLDGCWACSVGHDLRIIFDLNRQGQQECVVLISIGTHDKVY
jgi:addiction module RelE/StbE family toxin